MPTGKIILSILIMVAAFIASTVVSSIIDPAATLTLGATAGNQLANSDAAYLSSYWTMQAFKGLYAMTSGVGLIISVLALAGLVAVWVPYIKRVAAGSAALLLVFALSSPAFAFWSTTNTTEAYGILPNHSAFWIPGMGDSKDNQARMESEEFLKANKVQAKFFVIPHVKLSGSVYIGWDYYIPAGRLIVVDRAPYFHEWTGKGRGNNVNSDESFHCHTQDNIEVSTEMSLASSVTEDDAAKFLFYFGVKAPEGDASQPAVIFTSVFEGRSLNNVMSTWGRGEIQSRVCRHVLEHTVEDLATSGNDVLDKIQDEAKKFFHEFGITVEYIGWAGGFHYPQEVQNAINTRFAAEHVQKVIPVLQAKAWIDAISGWDRHLPSSVTFVGGVADVLKAFTGDPKAPIKP